MTKFQINDPSLESQWRAIILFGKNSATYKFAFAKSLLEIIEKEKTKISLEELAMPFADSIIDHLKKNDKQGNSNSSTFLEGCRSYINGNSNQESLYKLTEKYGFVNVVDAFQNVNGGQIQSVFYEKDYSNGKKEIVITDNLLKLKELFQYRNLEQEVEARWNLVETAWNLQINPNLLEVKYDEDKSLFFIESNIMRRIDITSVRDSLNGYQKGKCFYSFQDISINKKDNNICEVDHFLPHLNKIHHTKNGANMNDSLVQIAFKKGAIRSKRKLEFVKENGYLYYAFWLFRKEVAFCDTSITTLMDVYDKTFSNSFKKSIEGTEITKILNGRALKKDSQAPTFITKDVTGKIISLDNYKNKFVLLTFWASWCGPCVEEMPAINAMRENYSLDKFEIISVTLDDDLTKFKEAAVKYNMNWKHIFGDKDLVKKYGVIGIPEIYLIDKSGKIIYKREEEKDYKLEYLTKLVAEKL